MANICSAGTVERRCPSEGCSNHRTPIAGFFIKWGYFKTKWNGQPIPRYRCKECGANFSSHTGRAIHGQHRPDVNDQIFKLYTGGMTLRRIALVLGLDRKTVARKFIFLAALSRQEHERRLASGELKTSHAQFDEMETFEHTRMKPVSVVLAVRAKTGEIIDARTASMSYKGPLAAQALAKYGPRSDETAKAIKDVLSTINSCAADNFALTTDANPRYLNQIRNELPQAVHHSIKHTFEKTDRSNKGDKLFTLNYTAAKLRNDLSRMARKTWVTTKRIARLKAHLDLYIAYNNGYQIAA